MGRFSRSEVPTDRSSADLGYRQTNLVDLRYQQEDLADLRY